MRDRGDERRRSDSRNIMSRAASIALTEMVVAARTAAAAQTSAAPLRESVRLFYFKKAESIQLQAGYACGRGNHRDDDGRVQGYIVILQCIVVYSVSSYIITIACITTTAMSKAWQSPGR